VLSLNRTTYAALELPTVSHRHPPIAFLMPQLVLPNSVESVTSPRGGGEIR